MSPIPDSDLQNNIAAALLKTVISYASRVLQNPTDYAARANIMWTSSLALNGIVSRGKLCDCTCHAIEHELSGLYDIPHGLGLAILLPHYLRVLYNNHRTHASAFEHFARSVWLLEGTDIDTLVHHAIDRLQDLIYSMGLTQTLSQLGIPNERFEPIARTAVGIRGDVRHYPQLSRNNIVEILHRAT